MNFDASYEAIYIQSATLNGKNYTKNWIDHSFFTEGKELVLTLGRKESSWGQAVADLPPSVGSYKAFPGGPTKRIVSGPGLDYGSGSWDAVTGFAI